MADLPSRKKREVPDTFHILAEYAEEHSLVLTSSMANSEHIPGTIRGHEGTVVMVEHGQFERYSEFITVKPEKVRLDPNADNQQVRRLPRLQVRHRSDQDPGREVRHDGAPRRQLPQLHAYAREATPGR